MKSLSIPAYGSDGGTIAAHDRTTMARVMANRGTG